MAGGNDMERQETYVDNLLISWIESWNEKNPKSKLSSDMICDVRLHIDLAYTVATERTFRKINRELRKYCGTSRLPYNLVKRMLDPDTYKL